MPRTLGSLFGSVKRKRLRLRLAEAVAAQLLVQALAREAERARRLRLVPPRALEGLAQPALLERAGLGVEPCDRRGDRPRGRLRPVTLLHPVACARYQDRERAAVLELAHVARPRVADQLLRQTLSELGRSFAESRRGASEEAARQQEHVAPALAQRRQPQAHRVEPVVEIGAERAG